MPSRSSMRLICGPPPWTTIGLMPTCFSSTMSRAKVVAAVAHRVAAILDDDGLAGIAAQIGQRLGQDRGLDRVGGVGSMDGVSDRARRSSRPRDCYRGRPRRSADRRQSRRAWRAARRCRAAFRRWSGGSRDGRGVPRQFGGDALGDRGASSSGRACRSWSARPGYDRPAASHSAINGRSGSLMPCRASISRQTRRRLARPRR